MEYPTTKSSQLPDQRKIAYCEYGEPNSQPVFFFHGTPGSRYEPLFGHQAALKNGIRLIAPDRPGIGGSDYQENRSLLDWTEDVNQIADQLGISTFGVMGASGGGPHALACAYSIPKRLRFTILLGSWAPILRSGLAEFMAPLDQFFSRLAARSTFLFSLPFYWFVLSSRYLSPGLFVKSMDSSLCEADRKILENQQVATLFQEDVRESFAQGVRGPAEEAIMLYGEWGFELSDIKAPVQILHGEQDKFAPYPFAEYIHENLPDSRLISYQEEGHLFFTQSFDEIFNHLA
ncbi:MAG: alpha/beta fold hydrolase [Anaerolineales bacterium]|jgi:pimeloyl-ACP methyl ester carboxylesterase